MRILQIIDSMEAGGAERMAVNYANALSHKISCSGLVCTRKEGILRDSLDLDVQYLFLEKKSVLDLKAIFKLKKFVKDNNFTIIHAHSSSFFTAVLLKMFCPGIKIIWHDHYGESEFLKDRKALVLKRVAIFFKGIIAVNQSLLKWNLQNIKHDKVVYLPNFTDLGELQEKQTDLCGNKGKRILCLANLREQKNHFFLLDVAKEIVKNHPDWSFHLVGKDFKDDYSKTVRIRIKELGLEKHVFLYGSRNDVSNIIKESDIGILTSKSEGLPVALLEYGYFGLPVVVTNVGEIPNVVESEKNGLLVGIDNSILFSKSLCRLIENEKLQEELGKELRKTVFENYSSEAVIEKYLKFLGTI